MSLAEKTAFDVIKKQSAYEYWVTKSYVLLGDIYIAQKDNFNAIATYKSVAENASIEELKLEAANKLKLLVEYITFLNGVCAFLCPCQRTKEKKEG